MEKSNPDKVFKNIIENNNEYFKSEAAEAKRRIWDKVKLSIPGSDRKTGVIRILAAACIILLFMSSIFFYALKKEQKMNRHLTGSYTTKLKDVHEHLAGQADTVYIQKYLHDTIVKIREKEVTKTEYVTEVIYKTDTIREISEKPVAKENFAFITNEEKSYEIKGFGNSKRIGEKDRKFTIHIGGNKNDLEDTPLAFQN